MNKKLTCIPLRLHENAPADMERYKKDEHDFDPRAFKPGRIHRIGKDAVMFRDDMTPAVALWDPKYPHNVGAAVRAASCFGAKAVIFSGKRIPVDGKKASRLPREERMKGYYDITIINDDYFFNRFSPKVLTPWIAGNSASAKSKPAFEKRAWLTLLFSFFRYSSIGSRTSVSVVLPSILWVISSWRANIPEKFRSNRFAQRCLPLRASIN